MTHTVWVEPPQFTLAYIQTGLSELKNTEKISGLNLLVRQILQAVKPVTLEQLQPMVALFQNYSNQQ